MQSTSTSESRILQEYKELFDMLEEYDRTRQLPFDRVRVDITLSRQTLKNLKSLQRKTGKPLSRIIEETVEAYVA